ncbi:unnamed protein product [Dovyalis caffra]|uniref:Uncharacterized protein n=1 Tax=Dovyalis caffra TaxID=77055 RepID=A0AAV1RW17_9ROSI|nr:unnamed protein product [Dovyalis caffra]
MAKALATVVDGLEKMAVALATVVDGLGFFVSTLQGLQERRVLSTIQAVTSAITRMTMPLTLCFLAIHRHARVAAVNEGDDRHGRLVEQQDERWLEERCDPSIVLFYKD